MLIGHGAEAEITVYACKFPSLRDPLFITIYDDGSPARIGVEPGVGGKVQTHFDRATGATVVVELNGVGLPITLTTINKDGRAVHSRHMLLVPEGWITPSQTIGQCDKRAIR